MDIIILKKGDQELEVLISKMGNIIIIRWGGRQNQKSSSNSSQKILMVQQHLQDEDHLLQFKVQGEITQSVPNVKMAKC